MKSLILLVLISILSYQPVYAIDYSQEISAIKKTLIVDTAQYVITYSLKFKYSNSEKLYHNDTRIVQVGKNIVKDYSEMLYHYDSLATSNFKKGKDTPCLPDHVFPYEISNYTTENVSLVKYRTFSWYTYCFRTPKRKLLWELIPDTSKIILGHHCNMAKIHYAGRNYNAWYSMDIPLHFGPYKFSGLPGLIMQMEDEDKKYIWAIIGMQANHTPILNNIYKSEIEYEASKAYASIRKMYNDPLGFITSDGCQHMKVVSGKLVPLTREVDGQPIPFEPIELE